jgi:hypothetical protein
MENEFQIKKALNEIPYFNTKEEKRKKGERKKA